MDGLWSRTTLVATLCALASAGAPAFADAPGEDAAAVARAQSIARAYWGVDPCGGAVGVSWAALGPDTNASSTWENPVGAYDDPAENADCEIVFNSAQDWDWPRFCTVLVHEYGHLSGHPHSSDRGDVMYPYYQQPVAPCDLAPAAPPATA